MDKLRTFATDGGDSQIELVMVGLMLAFLTALVFALAVIQPEGLVGCIDLHLVVF